MSNLMRLDIRLAKDYRNFSRSFYQKLIWKGGVKVNGKTIVKSHQMIDEYDNIEIDEKIKAALLEIPDGPVFAHKALFSDKYLAAIDKPPFARTETLIKGFLPVHRLDKDTSGVLVVAKGLQVQARLQAEFKERKVKKTYVVLIKGALGPKQGAIEAGIFRSVKNRRKMAVSASAQARNAFTRYKVVKYFEPVGFGEKITLVKAFPETGRTHQIRVHFSSIGHPVVGDELYGDAKTNKYFKRAFGLKRQFLHAEKLVLFHPVTGKKLEFTSKLPLDLKQVVDSLKEPRN